MSAGVSTTAPSAAKTPSVRSCVVVEDLPAVYVPLSSSYATTSVKVPPMSIETR
jgi:hypothetical protein